MMIRKVPAAVVPEIGRSSLCSKSVRENEIRTVVRIVTSAIVPE